MEIVLLIAALAALCWGALFFRNVRPVDLGWLLMMGGCCFSAPFFAIPGGPVPITIDRVLWAALIAMAAWSYWKGEWNATRWGWDDGLLAALLLVVTASALAHDFTIDKSAPLSRLLFYYYLPAGVYWSVKRLPMTERDAKKGWFALSVFGLYLAITAIAEIKQLDFLVYPRYILSKEHAEFLGRGRGPLLNPAGNGLFIGAALAASLIGFQAWSQRRKTIACGWAATLLAGAYATLTRSVWMGTSLGLGCVGWTLVPKRVRMPLLVCATLVGATVAVVGWDSLMAFKRDKELTAAETADSAKLRPLLAGIAWRMFLDKPLLGCGFGQYLDSCVDYTHDFHAEANLAKARPYVQHNIVLSLLTETGLLGAGCYVGLLAAWALQSRRMAKNESLPNWARSQGVWFGALLINYCVNGMFQDMTIVPMANMLLCFGAGLTMAAARSAGAVEGDAAPKVAAATTMQLVGAWPGTQPQG